MAYKRKTKDVVCKKCGHRTMLPVQTKVSDCCCVNRIQGYYCGGRLRLARKDEEKKEAGVLSGTVDPTPADLKAADIAAAASHFRHEPKMVYEAIVEIRMYLDGSADPERYATMRCSTDDPGTLEEFLDNIGTAKASMDT